MQKIATKTQLRHAKNAAAKPTANHAVPPALNAACEPPAEMEATRELLAFVALAQNACTQTRRVENMRTVAVDTAALWQLMLDNRDTLHLLVCASYAETDCTPWQPLTEAIAEWLEPAVLDAPDNA